jgi:hypothetical protein
LKLAYGRKAGEVTDVTRILRWPLLCAALLLSVTASARAPDDAQRLASSLNALEPQRPGVVDAYVVVVALDSDPVFSREAREAGKVLAARFGANGRTIVLASDEGQNRANGAGTPQNLELTLRRAAELMDRKQDVLILYSTSHGVPNGGLVYRSPEGRRAVLTPTRFARDLQQLGVSNRLIILQACFSGQFVDALRGPRTIVVTAAAANRSSFGCEAGNDWTYFGDALINHAFRQPLPIDVQFRRAMALVAAAEDRERLTPSNPQVSIGGEAQQWLAPLETQGTKAVSMPVGTSVLGLGR